MQAGKTLDEKGGCRLKNMVLWFKPSDIAFCSLGIRGQPETQERVHLVNAVDAIGAVEQAEIRQQNFQQRDAPAIRVKA